MEHHLKFYAIRFSNGKYFRAKGKYGYGSNCVSNLDKARIWSTISPAKSQVTYCANHYPECPVPVILELHVTKISELNQEDRIKDILERKEKRDNTRDIRLKERALESAKKDLYEAQEKISKLTNSDE